MIFDTHAHYDDEQFDADREELLSGMKAGGVGMIVEQQPLHPGIKFSN